MKVRLIRKLANLINGLDLSKARTGETLDLSWRDANMLVAEGWASEGAAADRDGANERRRRQRVQPGVKKR